MVIDRFRTCYLAGELLAHLRQRQPYLNITDKDVLCVQIAALCHDLGSSLASNRQCSRYVDLCRSRTLLSHVRRSDRWASTRKKLESMWGKHVLVFQVDAYPSSQHEQASIDMFDYMIKVNDLMPFFEQENLDETDLIFVKELIFGELNKQASDKVHPSLQSDERDEHWVSFKAWPYKGRDISKSFLYEVRSSLRSKRPRRTVYFLRRRSYRTN